MSPRSSLSRRRSTQLVGVAVLVGLTLVAALAYLKPNPFQQRITVRAAFADVSGLGVVGRDVRVAGVPVGEVVGEERSGGHAILTMEIDPSVGTIHADATAQLRPHLPFEGTAYVDLGPGSPSAPPLGDATIPLSATDVYVPLDVALRVFSPRARASTQAIAKDLASVLGGGSSSHLHSVLHDAPGLARNVEETAGAALGSDGTALAKAVQGLSRTSQTIAVHSDRVQPLLEDANTTLGAVGADEGAPLDASLSALPRTLEDLDSGGRAVDDLIARLDPLAHALSPGLAKLAPTLEAATPLVRAAARALPEATPLVSDLHRAMDAGAGAAPSTKRALARLDPILRVLHDSLLPALHADTPELHIPAYLAFLNLFEGGGGASRPFQTEANANPVEPPEIGHFMRFGIRFLSGFGTPLPPCGLLQRASPSIAASVAKLGACTP